MAIPLNPRRDPQAINMFTSRKWTSMPANAKERLVRALQREFEIAILTGREVLPQVWSSTANRPHQYVDGRAFVATVRSDKVAIEALWPTFKGATWYGLVEDAITQRKKWWGPAAMLALDPTGSSTFFRGLKTADRRRRARDLKPVQALRAGLLKLERLLRKYGAEDMLIGFRIPHPNARLPNGTGSVAPLAAFYTPTGAVQGGSEVAVEDTVKSLVQLKKVRRPRAQQFVPTATESAYLASLVDIGETGGAGYSGPGETLEQTAQTQIQTQSEAGWFMEPFSWSRGYSRILVLGIGAGVLVLIIGILIALRARSNA